MIKIYVSGKITGIEDSAPALFEEVEKRYKIYGYEVVNPMKLLHNHDKSWKAYMREDLKALKECTHIHCLDNGRESRGAIIEVWFARRYKKRFLFFPVIDNECTSANNSKTEGLLHR